ncbi:hypothetical protein D9756_002960 [Leucocoprinus leucothites]|uniref:Fork-head domain-containing protein n=1 Tax=Leucocoprinus leucothites TaxID=201217 RepID=A0A8H5G675_9AGAR|nr:hypothetical protein D9756_002960 [Leucoagaricus leucothites]
MFSHQSGFSLLPNENAVPGHRYSSSEGSENFPFGASASGDAFVRAGSADSAIGSLAANDEPYLPPRQQIAPTGNPSPLHYSVAPDYVPGHSDPSASPGHHAQAGPSYDNAYASQYRQQPTYVSGDGYDYTQDGPFIPPGFYPPPPLAQAQRHFSYQPQRVHQPVMHHSQAISQPPIAPQIHDRRDLSLSPASSNASLARSFGHQMISSLPPSPPRASPHSEVASQRMSEPIQVPMPAPVLDGDQQGEGSHPEPPADDGNDSDGSVHSEHWLETDKYLRNQIGIPEGTRVDLWALPDPPPGHKPQQPLPILVKLAIHGCERGMLTLQEIYQALEDRFEYFARLKSSAWKNSIRHNLSLNQVFRSCDRPITEPGKGRYWSLDISKGEGYKRERRRKRRNAAPYNGTRDLPGGIGNRVSQEESSDPDQEMEDDTATGGKKAPPTAKRGRKRGPYTRITIGQPSIPGSTGITPGGAAAAAIVSAHMGGSHSPASSPGPSTRPMSGSAPVGGSMMYASASAGPSSSNVPISHGHHHHHSPRHQGHPHAGSPSPMTLVPPMSHHQNAMRGVQQESVTPATLPYPIASSYHGMYFNRAPAPTFGQPSLPSYAAQGRVGFLTPVGGGGGGGGGRDEVSSDGGSSPEMGERMAGMGGGGRM